MKNLVCFKKCSINNGIINYCSEQDLKTLEDADDKQPVLVIC